jgi:hypothetical protein
MASRKKDSSNIKGSFGVASDAPGNRYERIFGPSPAFGTLLMQKESCSHERCIYDRDQMNEYEGREDDG